MKKQYEWPDECTNLWKMNQQDNPKPQRCILIESDKEKQEKTDQ